MNSISDLSQIRDRAKVLVCEKLAESPLSVGEIENFLFDQGIPFCRRFSKEIAWEMAEEGTACFNDEWLLELR